MNLIKAKNTRKEIDRRASVLAQARRIEEYLPTLQRVAVILLQVALLGRKWLERMPYVLPQAFLASISQVLSLLGGTTSPQGAVEERERRLAYELEELRALIADERAALDDLLNEAYRDQGRRYVEST